MVNVSVLVKQLKKERDLLERQLSGLNAALSAMGAYNGNKPIGSKRGQISAAGRARIAAAQRARWAKIKRAKKKAA